MKIAPLPADETIRLEKLKSYEILDTPPENEYDEIVRLASIICDTPISTVTLIDEERQWFKAQLGLDSQESSRDISFCAHAVATNDLLIVPDATKDDRFFDNPFVTGAPDIRFYAGMPLRTADGHALGTLCVIDRTPKSLNPSQLEALEILSRQVVKYMELRKRTVSLLKSHESNTRLISIISHDIKGPLQSLQGLITLVEDYGLAPEEFKAKLPEVKTKITGITKLLSQLLEWSTSQFDENSMNVTEILLNQLVEETVALNHQQFQQKNNTVLNLIDPGIKVRADEHMTAFVIRNLLLNANKFSQAATIRATAIKKDDRVEVCISDEGVGIPAERLETLFSWEHRSSAQGTKGEKGSGFALLIAKDFIAKNHGNMRVESTPGKGTQFYFSLPGA